MKTYSFSQDAFLLIAGPCLIESRELLFEVADAVVPICQNLGIDYVFKGSYRKANRSSSGAFSTIGDERALEYLAEIRDIYNVPVLTDIHSVEEAAMAAQYVDILQIPAFLSRQTDILTAAAETGKVVNIKKGQFMAPDDMSKAAKKITDAGNKSVWLTERGSCFGYHDLVVDFRGLEIMRKTGFPIIFDATHSVQQPSIGEQSGGKREFILPLARAAVAVGVDGLFLETHPNPSIAKSDAATQLPLDDFRRSIQELFDFWMFFNEYKRKKISADIQQ